jgi:hypothetical protein
MEPERLAPCVDRGHSTYDSATNPITPDQLSSSALAGLGDMRLITSYQGWWSRRISGSSSG